MTEARPLPARWIVLLHPFTAAALVVLAAALWIAEGLLWQDPVERRAIFGGYARFERDDLVLMDDDVWSGMPRELVCSVWEVEGVAGTWSPVHRRRVVFGFSAWIDWERAMLPDGFEDDVRQQVESRVGYALRPLRPMDTPTGDDWARETILEFAAAGDGALSLLHLAAVLAGKLAWGVFAVGILVIPASFWSAVRQRKANLLEGAGRCARCGHPRLSARACPECGAEVSVRTAIAERREAARATHTVEMKEPAHAPSSHA